MQNIVVHNANRFESHLTQISFEPKDFERMRISDELYGVGSNLFEIREKTIHVTTLPKPLIASNYPEFSDIFQSDWDFTWLEYDYLNSIKGPVNSTRKDDIRNFIVSELNQHYRNCNPPYRTWMPLNKLIDELASTYSNVVTNEKYKVFNKWLDCKDDLSKVRYLYENRIDNLKLMEMKKLVVHGIDRKIGRTPQREVAISNHNGSLHSRVVITHFESLGIDEKEILNRLQNGIIAN